MANLKLYVCLSFAMTGSVVSVILFMYYVDSVSDLSLFDITSLFSNSNAEDEFNFLQSIKIPSDNTTAITLTTRFEYDHIPSLRKLINQNATFDKNRAKQAKTTLFRVEQNEYAIFCNKGYHPIGIGNALSIYWTARAMAYFMNYTWMMNERLYHQTTPTHIDNRCKYQEYPMLDPSKKLQWQRFLPMQSNSTFLNDDDEVLMNIDADTRAQYANHYNLITQSTTGFQAYAVPYHSPLLFVHYNAFFVHVIKRDTKAAFQRFYQHTNKTEFAERVFHEMETQNVIVVHLRLGDTLVQKNKIRIVLSRSYFTYALQAIYEQLDKRKTVCKVYIIAQLSETNAHARDDVKALKPGNEIAYFMKDELNEYVQREWSAVFQRIDVQLIGNETSDDDYFRMAAAKYLVCSPSSFCLEAAIANFVDAKMIVFPSHGPWWKLRKSLLDMTKQHHAMQTKYRHHFMNARKFSKPTSDFGFADGNDTERFKKWFLKN